MIFELYFSATDPEVSTHVMNVIFGRDLTLIMYLGRAEIGGHTTIRKKLERWT